MFMLRIRQLFLVYFFLQFQVYPWLLVPSCRAWTIQENQTFVPDSWAYT